MKFFADTAEIAEIRDLAATGLLDGVTTNPSLVQKSGRDFVEVLREITEVCRPGGSDSGSVTEYATSTDWSGSSSNWAGSTTVYSASGPVGVTVTTCVVNSRLCSRSASGTAMPGIDVVVAGSSDVVIVIALTVVRPREL